ncbi:KPN_02809 family neutral zinc metallopeptidase [Lignipirellula cremea]|uniref:Neutral zinc metallopeptidase n=1 Tax=Lignipirellula cremea TaxID=2528010 RepID=A0A518DYG8_9BACT|nr:neutral zinc metallopeptidase [Lignipirellula cremea]QDU96888.1 Putative neutral zinc metallopeptidase [Lignipirellula cremea]
MKWRGRRGSDNVIDGRSTSMRGPVLAGGGGLLTVGIVLVALFLGVDPSALLNPNGGVPGGGGGGAVQQRVPDKQSDERKAFVSVVLADTEDVWTDLFQKNRMQYQKPKLHLFHGEVRSACGAQSAAVGPFYCPLDETVYIDLGFYDELRQKLGAPGDFAQAYVIAHEVGHHVQNLLGTSDQVHQSQTRASKAEGNQLSVRLELQADFYAGVWAHHAQKKFDILEEGDIDEALGAATAIGDDRLQQQSRGYIVPESFTHGSSEQRKRWFYRGFKTGDMNQGDTFSIPYDQL